MKLLAISVWFGLALAGSPKAHLKSGTITGTHNSEFDQDFFLGIPYAKAPVDDLRFEPAQIYEKSLDGFNATSYGPSCYWTGSDITDNLGLPLSEDCLQLNIVRPKNVENKGKLPVAVWIHGGGFQYGASMRDIYNLSYPVSQSVQGETPVIGVSINYRLAGFGFLASDELKDNDSLNLGLRDQRVALQWIQENIEAFGGDPDQVTIWGESAGSWSVSMQLVAHGGKDEGLFARAVMESGSVTSIQYPTMQQSNQRYNTVLNATGCSDLQCLKKLPAQKLNDAFNATAVQQGVNYYPVIDGEFFRDSPFSEMTKGHFVKVPILAGTNLDEGAVFSFGWLDFTPTNTDEQFADKLQRSYPGLHNSDVKTLMALYPNIPSEGCPFNTGDKWSNNDTLLGLQFKRANAMAGDLLMQAARRFQTDMYSAYGMPVYSYNWDQPTYGSLPPTGTAHFVEVVFVFANPSPVFAQSQALPIGPDPSGNLTALSHLTSRRFMSFMATGDPNNAKIDTDKPGFVEPWPEYGQTKQNYYFKGVGCHVEDDNWRSTQLSYINYVLPHKLYH